MIPKRILWPLYLSFQTITLVALLALFWYASHTYKASYFTQRGRDLETSAKVLRDRFAALLTEAPESQMDSLCKELRKAFGLRVTVISRSGVVIGDSQEEQGRMDNYSYYPEVKQAKEGKIGEAVRFSEALNRKVMHVAIPLYREKEIVAVIRVSSPLTLIYRAEREFYLKIILGGISIVTLAAISSLLLFRRISQPLQDMIQGAKRFAQGQLDLPLEVPSSSEIGSLAKAMNQMAAELNERIRTIMDQRQELEAVLSSMTEGVIAVDKDKRILRVNQAASKIFEIEREDIRGKPLVEVIRNSNLQKIVDQSLQTESNVEKGFEAGNSPLRFLNAYSSPWLDAKGAILGVVVVVADITRLNKLESLRKDFVANVSHELKTPVTSTKGYVETLLHGAYKEEEDALRFLQIIAKQTDRLHRIIEDLLTLSRIEEGSKKFPLERVLAWNVLESARETCQPKAEKKGIELVLEGAGDIQTFAHSALLEQAVINLIDNAINHSHEKGRVTITLEGEEEQLVICVQDQGIGIPREHLPRLYERFYRVDKARSWKSGSTGLGLAIVKHIAIIHQGTVSVQSTLGKGSAFSLSLPRFRA